MMEMRQLLAGAVDSVSGDVRGVASADKVSVRSSNGAVRPPQTGRNIMAKKTKKTGGKGKTETQKKAELAIEEVAVEGTTEAKDEAKDKSAARKKDEQSKSGAGDAPKKAQAKAESGTKKNKEKSDSGEKPAFATHLHDYDIGQPKPEMWEKPSTVEIPGGGEISVTLYFGRFGDAMHVDDKGNEIPFERKADRTKWLAAEKTAWRRTQGGTALRQKCRGRLRAVISKVKYIGVHQGAVITEEQGEMIAQAQALLEEVYGGINEKGIIVDPKTGAVLDCELNTIAQKSEAKAS